MKKYLLSLVFVFLFLSSVGSANASLLTFTDEGEIYWNVLGITDDINESALEIKKIANDFAPTNNESIALANEEGKVYLTYGKDKKVDVTGYLEDIVEIEEVDAPSKVLIEATESGFAIKQRGIKAQTSFPIKINSPENKLTVETPTGEKFLSTLPYEAVRVLENANLISHVNEETINIVEKEEGELAYEVTGKKYITLFKLFSFEVPIKAEVSAISGNVVNLDQPIWYAIVGYFLS